MLNHPAAIASGYRDRVVAQTAVTFCREQLGLKVRVGGISTAGDHHLAELLVKRKKQKGQPLQGCKNLQLVFVLQSGVQYVVAGCLCGEQWESAKDDELSGFVTSRTDLLEVAASYRAHRPSCIDRGDEPDNLVRLKPNLHPVPPSAA